MDVLSELLPTVCMNILPLDDVQVGKCCADYKKAMSADLVL